MMKASLQLMMERREERVARSTGNGRDSPRLGFPEPKARSRNDTTQPPPSSMHLSITSNAIATLQDLQQARLQAQH
ncbi:hypothetical protein L1887_60645 [Cichorium endivia]|nr:hypothetical protein L1887_60645 [Cichorium endivia]